jgi:hypothetical protein
MPKAPRSFWQSLREIDYVYWAIELAYVIAAPLAVISRHAWMLLLVFLPAWAYQHYRVRRAKLPAKRLYLGHCPDCGYDLRATRDQCPECGRVVTPAEQLQFGRNDRNEESHQEWPAWSWLLIALVVCATVFLFLPEGSGKYILFVALVGLYCYGVWLFIGWFERRGKQRPE